MVDSFDKLRMEYNSIYSITQTSHIDFSYAP